MPDDVREIKKQLRREILTIRRKLSPEFVAAQSVRIAAEFSDWPGYLNAGTVMFYLAMAGEPQTEQMIRGALATGKRVCVPLLGKTFGVMSAAEIADLDSLVTDRLGLKMPDPATARPVDPAGIDLIVVPGVAFDSRGNRLGMGAGYYDRFLRQAGNSLLLGLAWSCQVVAAVPDEPHDIRMQYLLTDKGFMACRREAISDLARRDYGN